MTTSFLGLNVNAAKVIPSVAAVLGLFNIANGTYSLLNPSAAAANFGLSESSPVVASAKSNPFIKVLGGRAISSGLGLLGCAYLGYHRAVGALLVAGIVTGVIDGLTVLNQADLTEEKVVPDAERREKAQSAAVGHIGIPVLCSAFGAWILLNV